MLKDELCQTFRRESPSGSEADADIVIISPDGIHPQIALQIRVRVIDPGVDHGHNHIARVDPSVPQACGAEIFAMSHCCGQSGSVGVVVSTCST